MNNTAKLNKKLIAIICAAVLVVAGAITALYFTGTFIPTVKSGSYAQTSVNAWNGKIGAKMVSANGHYTYHTRLNEKKMEKFTSLSGKVDSGNVTLTVTQGDTSIVTPLSGSFNLSAAELGLSSLEPGKIAFRFDFENAKGVEYSASWR